MFGQFKLPGISGGAGNTHLEATYSVSESVGEFFEDPAFAAFGLGHDGQAFKETGIGGIVDYAGAWLSDAPNTTEAALYEARVTILSGGLSGGDATGVWLSLGTDREWSRNCISGPATLACQFLLEIRQAATGFIAASSTITLTAHHG